MENVALTTQQLDYLARNDPYLEPIFRGMFASDKLPKEKDTRRRSAYIVNVDTHDKPGSHWISVFVENGHCEFFDSYGMPIKWYKPSPLVNLIFKHYQVVSNNEGQLQATDSSTCGHHTLFYLFARAKGKTIDDFIAQFEYRQYVDNDHKIGEKLRKLVSYVIKLGQTANQQGALRSVKNHVSLLDIYIKYIKGRKKQ